MSTQELTTYAAHWANPLGTSKSWPAESHWKHLLVLASPPYLASPLYMVLQVALPSIRAALRRNLAALARGDHDPGKTPGARS